MAEERTGCGDPRGRCRWLEAENGRLRAEVGYWRLEAARAALTCLELRGMAERTPDGGWRPTGEGAAGGPGREEPEP